MNVAQFIALLDKRAIVYIQHYEEDDHNYTYINIEEHAEAQQFVQKYGMSEMKNWEIVEIKTKLHGKGCEDACGAVVLKVNKKKS